MLVWGGFAGAEALLSDRDVANNPTIVDVSTADDDLDDANGTIVDPGGPSVMSSGNGDGGDTDGGDTNGGGGGGDCFIGTVDDTVGW